MPRLNKDRKSKQTFQIALQDLQAAFAECCAAKKKQFEQLLALGWSGQYEDIPSFLKHLEEVRDRLHNDAAQTASDIDSTTGAMELEEMHEKLAHMKSIWEKLRAEGVPINQRPLDPNLPWSVQFQVQAESDSTGKDMKWWLANKHKFTSLE
jgi:hypothetical protein